MDESSTQAIDWREEQQHWSRFYTDGLTGRLERVATFGRAHRDNPSVLQPHFESYLALLSTAAGQPQLAAVWLDLVDALNPWPLRWGYWPAWLDILEQAAAKAADLSLSARRSEYLSHISATLRQTGLSEPALAAAESAWTSAREGGDVAALAVAAAQVVAALRSLVRYEEAWQRLIAAEAEILVHATRQGVKQSATVRLELDLERLDLLRHFGRLVEAVAVGEAVIANLTASADPDTHLLATAYQRRATILWAAGHLEEAAADLQASARMFTEAGDALGAIFSNGNLGLVYYSIARYDQAEEAKLAAVRAAEALNAGWWLVRDIGELCAIYMARGRLESALVYCNRHVELARQFNDEAQLGLARGNRGVTLMLLGRYDKAGPDIEASLSLYRRQNRMEGIIAATVDTCLFLRKVGRVDEAAALAVKNHDDAQAHAIPSLQVLTARCLALFLTDQEQEQLLRATLSLARQHERALDVAGCLFSLSAVVEDAAERASLYQQAEAMVNRMGASAWLAGHSPDDPPLLPLFT